MRPVVIQHGPPRPQLSGVGYNQPPVLRCVHFIIVAFLTFSASGISALVISEPCTGYEQRGREDGACPPTCVTCGCCAQAVEPVTIALAISVETPVDGISPLIPRLPITRSRDILHVPKRFFS